MVEDGKTDNCFEGKNNIFFQERKATKWTMEVEYVASCVIVRGNMPTALISTQEKHILHDI
jgi:hypothetical protein